MTTRRNFFKLMAGASALVAYPGALAATSNPLTLYGDGVHDDTDALNALIRGDAVQVANDRLVDQIGWLGRDRLTFAGAVFAISDSVCFEGLEQCTIEQLELKVLRPFEGAAIYMRGCSWCNFEHINVSGLDHPTIMV